MVVRRTARSVFAVFCLLFPALAAAQSAGAYPTKPVRLIVPYPPGGSTDYTAREIGGRLTEQWGQQIVVDHRPGAAATIGHAIGAKSTPDGYTLLLGTSAGLVVTTAFGMKIPYDPVKDFAPVGLAVHVPYLLAVHGSVPATTTKELLDLARAQPGRLNYASSGTGNPNHMGGELLKALGGVNIVHVPYKGGGPAITDLLGGQVQMMFSAIPQTLSHVKTGRLKAIAIGHPVRLRSLPDIPAVAETLPGFNNTTWYGLLAPAGTSRTIVAKVNADMNRILVVPEFVERLLQQGTVAATSTPEALHELIRTEGARWSKIIKDAGIGAGSLS
jgi:tripartite-type tricarboxylate transporter receptor subunit TctC